MIGIGADGRPQLPDLPGVKTYRVEDGNQNFYSLPFTSDTNPQQMQERMNLLNQLRAFATGPEDRQALDEAREKLRSLMAKK